MKLVRAISFVFFMAIGVTSLYGMGPLTQGAFVISMGSNFSEAYVLGFFRASNDYEQDILEEPQANSLSMLQIINSGLVIKGINQNYLSLLEFLIRKNINLAPENGQKILENCMDKFPKYAINSKEENDQKKLITFLIRKGMDSNGINRMYLNRVLSKAVLAGHPTIVELLIGSGAEVNNALLGIAPWLYDPNNMDMSRISSALLDAGANINLLDSHIGGNPGDNNPNDCVFNVIKAHKGFAFVGGVIGVGVIVWGCKKLYAKYQEYKNKQEQEQDDSEQAELVAD